MTTYKRLLSCFDIPGGVILGLFSLAVISLSCYAIITAKPFPDSIRDIYLGVVTAFAATNIAKHYKESKQNVSKK